MSLVESGTGFELVLSIDELDIPMVEPGQTVTVYADALSGVALSGVVEKIAPLGNTETSVTMYDVYVQLRGEVDSRLKSGMNVTGEILVSNVQNALLIPAEALISTGDGWTVQLQDGSYAAVELGVTTDNQVQIVAGLSEGDVVVY